MLQNNTEILIIGAGIFGVTAALELHRRGYRVTLLDEGPLPNPLGATTDISKVVRMEYGKDEQYMEMVEQSIAGFKQWNDELEDTLYHETGVTMFTRSTMAPGGFEFESYQMLIKRGHAPERMDSAEIGRRFPGWNSGEYVDGFYHGLGGYCESGRLVTALRLHAESMGVRSIDGRAGEIETRSGQALGVSTTDDRHIAADHIVVAAGAWTHLILPDVAAEMKATGHPVFHLKVDDPALFSPPYFAAFTADVAETGWYGFPVHPTERVMKIANHGVGRELHPEADPRIVLKEDERALRHFLSFTFPSLVDAPIAYTRLCLYCDTRDEHFWIDHHPKLENVTIASGGSGHGFKFAPVLGPLIADAVESNVNPWLAKFRWRSLPPGTSGEEAARFHG